MTAPILASEQRDTKAPLINILFGYSLVSIILSTTSNDLLNSALRVAVFGSILASFLGFADPINKVANWRMTRTFDTDDSVRWTLDAMAKMPSLMPKKIDLTPSTKRIGQWAKDSYYSPYLSTSRAKVVSEIYFACSLVATSIILLIHPFFEQTINIMSIALCLFGTGLILWCAFSDYLNLVSRAHIVAIFEMMITFGITMQNFQDLKRLLKAGNWSEARSWILRELQLPIAPWHWLPSEPRYRIISDMINGLASHWNVQLTSDSDDISIKLERTTKQLISILMEMAEKLKIRGNENKAPLRLAEIYYQRGIISSSMRDGIQILLELTAGDASIELLQLVGKPLSLIAPRMETELRNVNRRLDESSSNDEKTRDTESGKDRV